MIKFKRQETWARPRLRRPLSRAVRLTNDVLKLGITVIQSMDPAHRSSSGRTMRYMAARLLHEVRGCELLAQTGYPIQALSLAASAFELAYRTLYIGNDDARAKAWATHTDLRYSYPPNLKDAVRDFYRRRGHSQVDADLIYKNRFQPIAAAKHGNPKALSSFGLHASGDTLHIFLGPVVEPETIRACQMALVECDRLLEMVLANLIEDHMPARKSEYERPLTRLLNRTKRLGLELQSEPAPAS